MVELAWVIVVLWTLGLFVSNDEEAKGGARMMTSLLGFALAVVVIIRMWST
jgi:hypothetical protein